MRRWIHLGIMIHGYWYYFIMDENPLDANGSSRKILV
jgi:hypothetical protein